MMACDRCFTQIIDGNKYYFADKIICPDCWVKAKQFAEWFIRQKTFVTDGLSKENEK